MKNLLPQAEQKRIARMYFVRVATTALGLAIVAGLLSCVALLPAYFTVQVRNQVVTSQLESARSQISAGGGDEARSFLTSTQQLVTLAHLFEQFPTPSALIPLLRGEGIAGIAVNDIRINIESTENVKAAVQGKAVNRAALLVFSTALEEDPAVVEVTLPLRDLAANQDIAFTLTVSLVFPDPNMARP